MFDIGYKFQTQKDIYLRNELVPKMTVAEITEIDNDNPEFPYKVEFEGFKFGYWFLSEEELKAL